MAAPTPETSSPTIAFRRSGRTAPALAYPHLARDRRVEGRYGERTAGAAGVSMFESWTRPNRTAAVSSQVGDRISGNLANFSAKHLAWSCVSSAVAPSPHQ
jgi:hypothetical protein